MCLDYFDVLMSKMIFKKIKKHHLNVFRHEKHFEKLPQLHSQTSPITEHSWTHWIEHDWMHLMASIIKW